MVEHYYILSIQVKDGRSEIQGHPQLHSEFWDRRVPAFRLERDDSVGKTLAAKLDERNLIPSTHG